MELAPKCLLKGNGGGGGRGELGHALEQVGGHRSCFPASPPTAGSPSLAPKAPTFLPVLGTGAWVLMGLQDGSQHLSAGFRDISGHLICQGTSGGSQA